MQSGSPVISRCDGLASVRYTPSSKRLSLKMALMYKKEIIQGKIKRGEIDIKRIDKALIKSNMSKVSDNCTVGVYSN